MHLALLGAIYGAANIAVLHMAQPRSLFLLDTMAVGVVLMRHAEDKAPFAAAQESLQRYAVAVMQWERRLN